MAPPLQFHSIWNWHSQPGFCNSGMFEVTCRKRDKDKECHPYHVTVITPPPTNLGVHCLPSNTQCGETVSVKGEPYIVSGVTYRYQLRRGKYEPSQKRLEVLSRGRYLVNTFLENLYKQS
eukprot:c21683_g1_i2 orf=393-752(-)